MTEHIRTSRTANGVLPAPDDGAPDKKKESWNALTNAMYGALADAIFAAFLKPTRVAVRVVLISGEGDMPTAGNDVGEFAAIAARACRANVMSAASRQAISHRAAHCGCRRAAPSASASTMLLTDLSCSLTTRRSRPPFVNLALRRKPLQLC